MASARRPRRLRRLLWLFAITGLVVGGRRFAVRRRTTSELGPPASWPPLRPTGPGDEPTAAVGVLVTDDEPATDDAAPWVEPVDGECPLSHPIKANASSQIFHSPGGRFYARTRAERCYANPADAEADGYRAAKGS